MVPFRPHAAAAVQRAIDGARHAHRETCRTPTKRGLVAGFDDEVNVMDLHGKVHDAEASAIGAPIGGANGLSNDGKNTLRTK